MSGFFDGITNIFNELINGRNALETNTPTRKPGLSDDTLRVLYKNGIVNKIVRLKAGYALKNTLQFEDSADREFYEAKLAKHVKLASRFMAAFGRGIILLAEPGAVLNTPLPRSIDRETLALNVFSGDIVQPLDVERDVSSPRYMRPKFYNVRGVTVHHTRIIDFTYVEPTEFDRPDYKYGGISEPELMYDQLIQDQIITRASASIVEKLSSFIYKVKGLKDLVRAKKDDEVVKYFGRVESMRSIYGAVLIDQEDDATAINQQLSQLGEIDNNSLRRLALVSGVPLPWLVGENVKGMNAVGENERQVFQEMIETYQSDYLDEPLNVLGYRLGMKRIYFKENQGETPEVRINNETKAIENALKLWQMGEDHTKYLEDKGVIEKDSWDEFFSEQDEAPAQTQPDANLLEQLLGGDDETPDQ